MTANYKEKQLDTSRKADVAKNCLKDGIFFVISNDDSKSNEDWSFHTIDTFHVCPNRNLFLTYENVFKGIVVIDNNTHYQIAGIGRVGFKMIDGTVKRLHIVRHALDLKKNHISLITLDSKWYKFISEGGVLKVCKGARIMLEGQLKSQLYIFEYCAKSLKINWQMFSTLVDIQCGTARLEFGLEFVLKNTSQLSSGVIDNAILLASPVVLLYSIAKDNPIRNIRPPHRYGKADLVVYTLTMVEGVESSEKTFHQNIL